MLVSFQDRSQQRGHISVYIYSVFCFISYPGVAANRLLAVLTGVGVKALVTFYTVGILLSQNILLPKQGLLAVMAVIALSHFDPGSLT